MPRKNTYRTPAQKLEIIAYADQHGPKKAHAKYKAAPSNIDGWRKRRAEFEAQIAGELRPVHAKPPSQPAPEPSARQAITGLGALIGDIRAVVIEELAEEVSSKLAELIDARMPEIVARELRRLLTEQTLATGQVHPIRPVAKRA